MLPKTEERVPTNTSRHINSAIESETLQRLQVAATNPDRTSQRLDELEREWDIERTLEANAAAIGLIGLALGAFVSPWFFLVPLVVSTFLLQHALQGWCPPIPILRRLHFRTAREIETERTSLKAVRGDFSDVQRNPVQAYEATRL
jgi:hypothetical protein